MAAPMKRLCLRRASHINQQWRSITTTAPSQADALTPSDPQLDQLRSQPGVTYTTSTEPDKDLGAYNPTNLSSLAHRELEQHRELREMVRLAAWEMPLLSTLAKPQVRKPREQAVLKWRYTTYMGESHPAARKVVVTMSTKDIPGMNGPQVQKLLKLAGSRYNPTKKEIKMSCESFETPAQNKKYLADTLRKLVAEAKDLTTETFEDVPLDLRHHKFPVKHTFPKDWIMTNERRIQLEGGWKESIGRDVKELSEGTTLSGLKVLEVARAKKEKAEAEAEAKARLEEPVKQPVVIGRGGRRGR